MIISKARRFFLAGLIILSVPVFRASAASGWGDYLVACGDEDLYIVNAATSVDETPDVIWHWNVFETYGQITDQMRSLIRVLDDCKPVNGGKQLLLTSSAGGTILLDIATRKCLFHAVTPMAHSAEMLPGGRIAIANSTNPKGNSLEIYDSGKSEVCIWKDSLYSGHGVVWSEKYDRLFALGYKELRMYGLKDWESEKPSLVLEKVWDLPGKSGHDLNRAGDDALTVTNHDGVYLFDIPTGKFKPMPGMNGKKNVKSFNYDAASRKVVYTIGETRWWTNHIYLKGFPKAGKALTFDPAFRLYKVRVLDDWDPSVLTSADVWAGAPSLASTRCEGATLRIFDDNVWQYDGENIPEAWIPLDVDPRDSVRSIGFAKMVADYAPDVVTFQEYSAHLNEYLGPKLRALGFTNTFEEGDNWNFTPIFYDSTAVQLLKVNYNLYTPATFCDIFKKSFTSAVFRNKKDGKVFALLNTHLWYKKETVMPGSTMARAAQIRLMMAEAEMLKAEYNCPIFMVGDMNSEEDTVPIRQLLDAGYVPCYKAATVFGDNQNGHHHCSATAGYDAGSNRRGPTRAEGALDHFFIYNPQAAGSSPAEVLVYYCITDAYTLPLTDHYPNYVDVKL